MTDIETRAARLLGILEPLLARLATAPGGLMVDGEEQEPGFLEDTAELLRDIAAGGEDDHATRASKLRDTWG